MAKYQGVHLSGYPEIIHGYSCLIISTVNTLVLLD